MKPFQRPPLYDTKLQKSIDINDNLVLNMYLHTLINVNYVFTCLPSPLSLFPARRLVLVPLRSSRPRRRFTRLRRSTTLRGLRRYAAAPAPSALRRLDLGAVAPRPSAAQ